MLNFIKRLGATRFDLIDEFNQKFISPGYDFNINAARLAAGLFIVWKLLSRNFEFYGYVPEDVFNYYPIDIYKTENYILWTGIPLVTDLLTFHWVHWFIDRPGPAVLQAIQWLTITMVSYLAIVGKGPKNMVLFASYCLMIYLWGHLFLTGQEIDSIMLYFGILLMLGISRYKDVPLWRFRQVFNQAANINAGKAISRLYLVFITYYFASGVRKLTDLKLTDWLEYDLIATMERSAVSSNFTSINVPDIFQHIFWIGSYGNFLPSMVYMSHLMVPLLFFKRHLVLRFFFFYAAFHFMTFGVSISFTGYILVWGCLFHYREWLSGNSVAGMRS